MFSPLLMAAQDKVYFLYNIVTFDGNFDKEGLKVKVDDGKSVEKLKDEYREVIKELEKGESIRRTAKLHDVSISTVQRIKKLFSL